MRVSVGPRAYMGVSSSWSGGRSGLLLLELGATHGAVAVGLEPGKETLLLVKQVPARDLTHALLALLKVSEAYAALDLFPDLLVSYGGLWERINETLSSRLFPGSCGVRKEVGEQLGPSGSRKSTS